MKRPGVLPGLEVDGGRILVDDRGWTGLVDAAADPDPQRFAAALGASEPNELTAGLHWTVRSHIEATLGVFLAGRSSDGTAVAAQASSDGQRFLMLLDTQSGTWGPGEDTVSFPDQVRQVVPGMAVMAPIAMLDLMQVGSSKPLGMRIPATFATADLTALLWRTGDGPADLEGDHALVRDALRDQPWRHWRVRATSEEANGSTIEDGLDIVVFAEALLIIEGVRGGLEVSEINAVGVLQRVIEVIQTGLATGLDRSQP